MPLGAVAGSILLTPLQKLGRKNALIASCIMYTIGAILCAASPIPKHLGDGSYDNTRSRDVMYAGRFLLGVGVGVEGGGVGVYIAESVPSKRRGASPPGTRWPLRWVKSWVMLLLRSSSRSMLAGVTCLVPRWSSPLFCLSVFCSCLSHPVTWPSKVRLVKHSTCLPD